jgi:2-keto-3-deoxy-L-rhamnonate aldolase RhmA
MNHVHHELSLRARIWRGDTVVGVWCMTPSPTFTEIAALQGLEATFRKLAAAGVPTGTVPHSGRTWQQLAAVGVQLHAVASDVGLMRDGVKSLLSSIVEHQSA